MTEFEQIYRTYFNDVFLYIRKLSNSEDIAEEITSETFFKAVDAIGRFRGECDLRVWLCQIAKNCYYSYLKRNRKTENIEDIALLNLPSQEKSIEERLVQQDQAAQLQEMLHALSDPYKEVFMWRVFAELSFQQIGQIFGKSENWACVTYHRARKMIRGKSEVLK